MTKKAYRLGEADLHALSLGAALLGTGGGGNPHIGMLRTREIMRRGGVVEIIPVDALADDDLVVSVGGIGAPVVGVEKFEQGEECLRAMRALEDTFDFQARAVISAEIGGANAMEPMLTGAQAGIPIIDGDGMGRAFPEVQMDTFFIYGLKPCPAAIADEKGNVVVFRDVIDMYWLERFSRSIAVNMGAAAGYATPPMTGAYLKEVTVRDTVTQAIGIGHTILNARKAHRDVIDAVLDHTGARLMMTGKTVDVHRELKGGFAVGEAIIEGVGDWQGVAGKIAIQNENLILWRDGEVAVTVPDLIVNLDLDTGEPITTEVLRYGQRLAVIALRADPLMTTERALEVVGPAAFGYPDLCYRPLERVGDGSD